MSPHPSHDFGCTILGSGSKGNASVIHGPEGNLLLDAGFSTRELLARLSRSGIEPESIRAILVTHEHSDHVSGCRTFGDRFGIPAYVTPDTCRMMAAAKRSPEKRILISPGSAFDLCGIHIDPFSISHDVVDAVAYTFRVGDRKLGYATDLGCLTMLVMNKLRDCEALVLESNYDPAKLRASARPIHIKRRIMGRQGHLSNADAIAALGDLLTEATHQVVFAHLSQECNDSNLVYSLACGRLSELHREDVVINIASQTDPLQTIWLE